MKSIEHNVTNKFREFFSNEKISSENEKEKYEDIDLVKTEVCNLSLIHI